MNTYIFNTNQNPVYIVYEKNATYQSSIQKGNAYYFSVEPTVRVLLITAATYYYVVQVTNPSYSTKNIFLESLEITRVISGWDLIISVDTNMTLYNGGAVTTLQPITTINVNATSTNTSIAEVGSQGFGQTNPLIGGTLIDTIPVLTDGYTYYNNYNGGMMLPKNTTLTLLFKVAIESLIAIDSTVTLFMIVRYWEE